MMPAICSVRVKGSWIRMLQAQQATMGARKVITVASERGRYCRESLSSHINDCSIEDLKGFLRLTVHPIHPKKSTNTPGNQEFPHFSWSKWRIGNACQPLVRTAEA